MAAERRLAILIIVVRCPASMVPDRRKVCHEHVGHHLEEGMETRREKILAKWVDSMRGTMSISTADNSRAPGSIMDQIGSDPDRSDRIRSHRSLGSGSDRIRSIDRQIRSDQIGSGDDHVGDARPMNWSCQRRVIEQLFARPASGSLIDAAAAKRQVEQSAGRSAGRRRRGQPYASGDADEADGRRSHGVLPRPPVAKCVICMRTSKRWNRREMFVTFAAAF